MKKAKVILSGLLMAFTVFLFLSQLTFADNDCAAIVPSGLSEDSIDNTPEMEILYNSPEMIEIEVDCYHYGHCGVCDEYADYHCSPYGGFPGYDGHPWLPCSFSDPIPSGNIVTKVEATIQGVGCQNSYGGSMYTKVFLNGQLVDGGTQLGDCWCETCYPLTVLSPEYVDGFPGYVYEGTNQLSLEIDGVSCISDVHLKLYYSPAEPGIEKSFTDTTLFETLLAQQAVLNDVTVSGDFNGTLDFTDFEIVSITTGSFAGKGFSKGEWEATFGGIPYTGNWQGALFLKPQEGKIYLKGAISGEISATVEGYLTESVPGSGTYDQYQATWRIGRLGTTTTSATINLNGTLSYQSSSEFPSTELYILQTNLEGNVYGDYSGPLSTVLTHLRVVEETNPYWGEGFSIISYTSESGSGEGWTYDNLVSPGKVRLKGLFNNPLFGIVTATLDESSLPRTLFVNIERVDLGLPPMVDLKVKTWGLTRVSPGQTISYVIEYRNDGLKAADEVVVVFSLDPLVEYKSTSEGGFYDEWSHSVSWNLFGAAPKTSGYLSIQAYIPWGLPFGTTLDYSASIANIEFYSDTDNGFFGNGVGAFDWVTGGNKHEQKISGAYAHKNNLLWIHAFQGTSIQDRLDVFKAYKGEATETNLLGDERLGTEQNPREVNEVHGFSGYTTIFIRKILDGHLKVKDRIVLISAFWFPQYDPEPHNDPWRVIYELRQKCPNAKIEIWQSERDKLPLGFWQDNQVKVPEGLQEDWLEVVRRDDCGHLQLLEEAYKVKKVRDETTNWNQIEVTTAHDPNIKYGPEGYVQAGQTLNYEVEFENEGEGIAFGVYITDVLDEDLDDLTLILGGEGTYNPSTRTITWFVGEVGPGEGGKFNFSVNIRGDAPKGTDVINYATVYFPSVPEITRTNGVVSIIPMVGAICGDVTHDNGNPVANVTVKVIDSDNNQVGDPIVTGADGSFYFDLLPVGTYSVMIVTPLGYSVSPGETQTGIEVTGYPCTEVSFVLTPIITSNDCRTIGYWKHQFDVCLSGRGSAQEDSTDLEDYLDLVHLHFDVLGIYTDLENFDFVDAKNVLTVSGGQLMEDRAKQQLFGLLLNFASERIGNETVVSEDGRVAAEAVTYATILISDGDPANDELAKTICDLINNRQMVKAGIIPESPKRYKVAGHDGIPKEYALNQNYPNPFNPVCNIAYALSIDCQVTLSIYNILGQKVRVLINEYQTAGYKSVNWDGKDGHGRELASGIYFYQLRTKDYTDTKKMVLLR